MVVLPLLPALHLVTPAGVVFAERWLYAGAAGLAAVAAGALALRPSRGALALAAGVCLLFAGLTVRRDLEWRSVEALVASSLRAYPGTAKVWNEAADPIADLDDAILAVIRTCGYGSLMGVGVLFSASAWNVF